MRTDLKNDDDIRKLVHTFYDKVQQDDRLGYIFNEAADVDWDHHLPKMVNFWSNIIFGTGRYRGRPYRQHVPLPIKRDDFSRWYNHFEQTVDDLFAGERAEYAKKVARSVAQSFAMRMEMDGKFDD